MLVKLVLSNGLSTELHKNICLHKLSDLKKFSVRMANNLKLNCDTIR